MLYLWSEKVSVEQRSKRRTLETNDSLISDVMMEDLPTPSEGLARHQKRQNDSPSPTKTIRTRSRLGIKTRLLLLLLSVQAVGNGPFGTLFLSTFCPLEAIESRGGISIRSSPFLCYMMVLQYEYGVSMLFPNSFPIFAV